MQKSALTEDSFVRELTYNALEKLAGQLDPYNLWERLASVIPTKPENIFNASIRFEPKYTMTDILKLNKSRSGTKALLKNWGIHNCKIKHLVKALYKANLNAAAEYIEQKILYIEPRQHQDAPATNIPHEILQTCHNDTEQSPSSSNTRLDVQTHLENGNTDAIDHCTHLLNTESTVTEMISLQSLAPNFESQLFISGKDDHVTVVSRIDNTKHSDEKSPHEPQHEANSTNSEENNQLRDIPFNILQAITNNFDERHYRDGGNLIGEGGFGKVFIGTFSTGLKVAVKCLNDNTLDSFNQFKTEVEALAVFRHENLVHLLGYSKDENGHCCLIYEYMSNGSLEERLACCHRTAPLFNSIRLEIIRGTARGIAFLHEGGLVHRDIKTANILLDANFTPKVGDFATARVFPLEMTRIMKTTAVIGTPAYMAPEALSFLILPSLDSFSFGVVILEVLTGLPVTDDNREEKDLKVHVQEHCSAGEDDQDETGTIYDLLDTKGGLWSKSIVERLYSISCRCLDHMYKTRPNMAVIVSELEDIR